MKSIALLFAAAMAFVPVTAQSQEGGHWENRLAGYRTDGSVRYVRVYCRYDGYCYRPRRYAQVHRDATRVYAYERREEREERRELAEENSRACREMRRAVGDQHLTVDGAKKAANESWAGTVRFHLGEKFMDLTNARNIVYTCSRSSIKEGGVTTLGQSLTRCEIEAQPCHPPREMEANGKDR
jgi:hypothetical protein